MKITNNLVLVCKKHKHLFLIIIWTITNMSVFQILIERGNSRVLRADGQSDTPWLLTTENGLKNGDLTIQLLVLTENGFIRIDSLSLTDNFQALEIPKYIDNIPNWSLITPRLALTSKLLGESLKFELNLFLERLVDYELPEVFGVTYDPINSPDGHLNQLLELGPSLIAISLQEIETMDPRKLISFLLDIRKKVPGDVALYLPGGGIIGFQSLFVGLGIDIVDDSSAYRFAGNDKIFIDGFITSADSNHSYKLTIKENLDELSRDFSGVVRGLNRNTLWTRIARDMHTHTNVARIISLLSGEFNEEIEYSKFPRNSNNNLNFTGDEGLFHPDVVKYRKRVLERYNLPDNTKLIILLPCSARKPYIFSKSHKLFENAINKHVRSQRNGITIWTLSSPIGVTPRELENIYPVKYYDIPVTGNWSNAETQIVGEMLSQMLIKVPNKTQIIVHVSEGYRGVIEYQKRNLIISWIGKSPTSLNALNKLTKTISDYFSNQDTITLREKRHIRLAKRTIQALVNYNHGSNVDLNYESIKLVGRPPRPIQIQKNQTHWITWDKLNGDLRLSPTAIAEIAKKSVNWIGTNMEILQGSTLYNIGIQQASAAISPGDEVVIFNNDKSMIIGVGVAIISGITMQNLNKGPAVKIRKKCQLKVE